MAGKKVLIFGNEYCAKCLTTQHKVGHYIDKWGLIGEIPVVFMDMDSLDGLSEGAFRDVWEVPTTIIEERDATVARWDGEVPRRESLRATLLAE